MKTAAYIVFYSRVTGQIGLVPVAFDDSMRHIHDFAFYFTSRKDRLWISSLKKTLKIDCVIHQSPLPSRCKDEKIFCAFSCPERALQCLQLWVETKGQQDLPVE